MREWLPFLVVPLLGYFLLLGCVRLGGRKKQSRVGFVVEVKEKQPTTKKRKRMLKVKLTTEQQVQLSAVFETAKGNPVAIVGNPVWASSDATVATVDQTGLVVSVAPGSATITVTGEGDPTAGVDTVTSSAIIEVVNPEAAQAVITAGTPALKP